MNELLLSDLHLPARSSPLRQAFARFLSGPAHAAQRVFILGDLFEYWLGDDVGLDEYAAECAHLRALTDSGVHIAFMRGNRDFLVGQAFARATGVELLEDPTVIELCGHSTLLSHGDAWCTGDRAYQAFRRFTRWPPARDGFLRLPRRLRRAIAERLRAASRRRNGAAMQPVGDVDGKTVQQAFETFRVTRIVHGHTHRPADHRDDRGRVRQVLPDWRDDRYGYLQCDGDRLIRRELPSDAR